MQRGKNIHKRQENTLFHIMIIIINRRRERKGVAFGWICSVALLSAAKAAHIKKIRKKNTFFHIIIITLIDGEKQRWGVWLDM
jgi:hypothetical protein